MVTNTSTIALVLLLSSSLFVYRYTKRPQIIIIHLLLMLATPWIINLILSKPALIDYMLHKPQEISFLGMLGQLTSTDYIFFKSVSGIKFATGDYGYFLPGFLPMVIAGFWDFLGSRKLRSVLLLLPLAMIISAITNLFVGYFGSVIFLIFLSVFNTIGFYKFINLLSSKKAAKPIKLIIIFNFLIISYEIIRLVHSINVQSKLAG